MPRPTTPIQTAFPYHVYNRTLDQVFYPQLEEVWPLFCDGLRLACWSRGLQVHAFVLMSNHYHLLASTPESNLYACLQVFQSYVSHRLTRLYGCTRYRFGTRYKWSLLMRQGYVRNVYRYVYQNPQRAGVPGLAENYPWGTLAGVTGQRRLEIPLRDLSGIYGIPAEVEDRLQWLNEPLPPAWVTLCQQGLRRWDFSVPARQGCLSAQRRQDLLEGFLNDAVGIKK